MARSSGQPGLIKIDFVRFFPHKFWISDWGHDETYSDGFRYKILSARDEKKGVVELVLVLQQRDGVKEEMHRAKVKIGALDGYACVFVNGLETEHNIEFEEQDFSRLRTAREFEKAVAEHGWSSEEPDEE